jgi:hypothetical protein
MIDDRASCMKVGRKRITYDDHNLLSFNCLVAFSSGRALKIAKVTDNGVYVMHVNVYSRGTPRLLYNSLVVQSTRRNRRYNRKSVKRRCNRKQVESPQYHIARL